MNDLLELAQKKYLTKNNISEKDYRLNLNNFILKIFLNCDPASYGKQFSNKLVFDLKRRLKTEISCVSDSLDRGDFSINYIPKNVLEQNKTNIESKYYEIKLSFLGKSKNYTIRNLRRYQNLDGYLLSFVDCENSFNQEIYLITSEDLFNNCGFKFTAMNGTKERNEKNQDFGLGVAFKKDSIIHENIKKLNLLDGNDFESLISYFEGVRNDLKKDFWKSNKKSNTNVLKFEVNGKEYYEGTSVKNYINFIKDIYHEKGGNFLKEVLHSFYVSTEPINYRQVYNIKGSFFINTYCSTKHKQRNIELICQKLGYKLNFYTFNLTLPENYKSAMDNWVENYKRKSYCGKYFSFDVYMKKTSKLIWYWLMGGLESCFNNYEEFQTYFYQEYSNIMKDEYDNIFKEYVFDSLSHYESKRSEIYNMINNSFYNINKARYWYCDYDVFRMSCDTIWRDGLKIFRKDGCDKNIFIKFMFDNYYKDILTMYETK